MKIQNSKLNTILNQFNKELGRFSYPESFKKIIKNILYSPILSAYIFNDPNLFTSHNFENINLGRFWTDIIIYQIKKQSSGQLLSHLKTIDLSENFGQKNSNILITKNEYPFIIPSKSYNSFIIWNTNQSELLDYDQIEKLFNLKGKDWLIWKNDMLYKSQKYIEHYHIILRDSIPKFKLEKILILQRHGPREPIMIPPKFIKTYWDNIHSDHQQAINNVNLTNLGKLYSKFVGEQLYNNYHNDYNFESLNSSSILFGSSNFQRTIETSILTLDGLKLSRLKINLDIFNFLSSDTIFTIQEKEIYNHKMSNPNINFWMDLSEINKQIYELTGLEIKSFKDYFELASTMRCYEFHNYQMLPDPKDNCYLLEIKNTIYNLSTYYYNQVHDPTNDFFNINKYLGKTVTDNLLDIFTSSNNKFTLLTSHDNLLMPTVKYLIYGILNNIITFDNMEYNKEFYTKNILSKLNYLDFPYFNSSIRFELWIDPISDHKKIRIYYGNLMIFEFNTIF